MFIYYSLFKLGDLDILIFDDKGVASLLKERFSEGYYEALKKQISLQDNTLSNPCEDLISLISKSSPSPMKIRRIVRKSTLGEEEFDPVDHADLNFVEVAVTHFLNLITSPRNPMQQTFLERTAASFTTVFILNNLFLSNNDIIDLAWYEKEIQTTENTKWDGVAFSVKDKKLTPVLVEFSGGLQFNNTSKKEKDDEIKIVSKILHILNFTQALNAVEYPIPQYYIRFFDGKVYFEAIFLLDNEQFVKRRFFYIICPSTCEELIEFTKKIPLLLNWKKTVINTTKKIIEFVDDN